MGVFKNNRSPYYQYRVVINGVVYQGSTRLRDRRKAERWLEEHRDNIILGNVDSQGKPLPAVVPQTLKEFAPEFMASVETRSVEHPETIAFYRRKLSYLLAFTPLAEAKLTDIDERLIESFIRHRRRVVSPASVNRELATLRKALRLAFAWRKITRVPVISLLPGERVREFVLSREQEEEYLRIAPQPLKDAALILIDNGLRAGELAQLQWSDILPPTPEMPYGRLCVRRGKTRNAPRILPLSSRVSEMLNARRQNSRSSYIFTNAAGTGPVRVWQLDEQNSQVREKLGLKDCVLHSFRHTCATRLGEAGMDAVAIMHYMGHGSLTIAQRYIKSTAKMVARAGAAIESGNRKSLDAAPEVYAFSYAVDKQGKDGENEEYC